MSEGARGLGVRLAGWFGVLGERDFRLFFIGFSASVISYGMAPVALTFGVLDKGYGVYGVSVVLAAETIALVVLLLVGGVLADRFPRKFSLLASSAVRFGSQGGLAILLLTGRPSLWVMGAAAALIGAGEAFFNPAVTGLVPELAPSHRLQQANGLRSVALAAGQVAGPGIAGVIVATDGPGWAIAITAATYLVSALCFLGLRIPVRVVEASESVLRELLDGWREFRSRTWLWLIVAQAATFYAFSYAPFMVVGAVVTDDHLGGAAAWGLFNAMIGVGSIAGGLVVAQLHSTRPLVTSTIAMSAYAIPIALIAVPTGAWLIAAGAGVAGAGFSVSTTLWETTLQQEVPRELLSRVSAFDWFVSAIGMPIGYVVVGPVAEAIGDHLTLILAAGWMVLSSALLLVAPSVRNLRHAP